MAASNVELQTVVVTGDVVLEWRLAKSKIAERNPDEAPLVDPRSYIQLAYEPTGAVTLGEIMSHALRGTSVNLLRPRPERDLKPRRPEGFWVSLALCSQYRRSKAGAEDAKAVWRIEKRLGIDRGEAAEIDREWKPGYAGIAYLNPVDDQGQSDVHGTANLIVLEQGRNGFDESATEERQREQESAAKGPHDSDSRNRRRPSTTSDDLVKPNSFWPASLKSPRDGAWLLTRWSRPGAPNRENLWKHVAHQFGGRIVAVISADHLRYIGAQITRNLSWERTVEDLFREIQAKWDDVFDGCCYLIVSLLPSGAVLFHKTENGLRGTLIYDGDELDSSWSDKYDGEMMGYNRCLAAAVGVAILRSGQLPAGGQSQMMTKALIDGILAGLVASRYLHIRGFEVEDFGLREPRNAIVLPKSLLFPARDVGTVIRRCLAVREQRAAPKNPPPGAREPRNGKRAARREYRRDAADGRVRARRHWYPKVAPAPPAGWNIKQRDLERAIDLFAGPVNFDAPNRSGGTWTILSTVLPEHEVLWHARNVVEWGRRFKGDGIRFPLLRVGHLAVLDRTEMEGLRAVQALMKDYARAPFVKAPLSIAVFGPSGTGKSFAITELARALENESPGQPIVGQPKIESLTFNLSQFRGPDALASALQRVRDVSLAGKTALVFWDEFDTHLEIKLGWLRSFLEPMQDGSFQDGATKYHVGRAIFVFAGSMFPTQHDFAEFVKDEIRGGGNGSERSNHYRQPDGDGPRAKSPDFMSRLVGFVDVPTLDHRLRGHVDPSVALRRAVLLRSFLRSLNEDRLLQYVRDPKDQRGEHHLRRRINVDQGVADAFLRVQRFKYHARSIEAIVKMSTLRGKDAFERSSLPPRAQLALHVDPDEFLDIVAAAISPA